MKNKFSQSDLLLIKTFLHYSQPIFITELSLDMDVDYLSGLCTRFLKKDLCLHHKLHGLDINQNIAINDYLNKSGTIDDKIFYTLMKATYLTLQKYYDQDGCYKL